MYVLVDLRDGWWCAYNVTSIGRQSYCADELGDYVKVRTDFCHLVVVGRSGR